MDAVNTVMAVPGAKGFDHQSMALAPPFLGGSRLLPWIAERIAKDAA